MIARMLFDWLLRSSSWNVFFIGLSSGIFFSKPQSFPNIWLLKLRRNGNNVKLGTKLPQRRADGNKTGAIEKIALDLGEYPENGALSFQAPLECVLS